MVTPCSGAADTAGVSLVARRPCTRSVRRSRTVPDDLPREIRDEDAVVHESASEAFRMHDPLQRTMNQAPFTVRVREHKAFMYMLRKEQDMKGVRGGCTIGERGRYAVLVDAVSRCSCQTPVSEAIERSVVASEGISGRTTRRTQRSVRPWATVAHVSKPVVRAPYRGGLRSSGRPSGGRLPRALLASGGRDPRQGDATDVHATGTSTLRSGCDAHAGSAL